MEDAAPSVRPATLADHVAVARVLDGALLDVEDLEARLAGGSVLVATIDERIVGAVAVAPEGPADRCPPSDWPTTAAHVRGIAVRRRHRRRGIGSELLGEALQQWTPLLADFESDDRPFYEALDCVTSIEPNEAAAKAGGAGNAGDAGSGEAGEADDDRCWALLGGG